MLTQRSLPLQMPGFRSHSLMSMRVMPSTGVADGADELDRVALLALSNFLNETLIFPYVLKRQFRSIFRGGGTKPSPGEE